MTSYILRRLGGLTVSLVVLSVVVFALMHTVPGGPFSYDQNMPQYMMDNIEHKYGLDQPVFVQYVNWLAAMLRGDFGIPFQSPTETVVEVVLRAWPVTLMIGAVSIAFAFGVGMLLGTIAAFNQNSWIDNIVTFAATLGMAVPSYVIGSILVIIVAVQLQWLPTGGWGEPKHLIMPVIAFSLGPMAIVARMTRVNLLETLSAEHVRLARARGIPTRLIVWRYVLKNASIPMITVLLPLIPDLLTGLHLHRGRVQRPRPGTLLHHQRPDPRLPDDHGHGDDDRAHLGPDVPHLGRALRAHRPARPTRFQGCVSRP